MAADADGAIRPLPRRHDRVEDGRGDGSRSGPLGYSGPDAIEPATRAAITARMGSLPAAVLAGIAAGRGREFQQLEFLGDALLELVIHAHATLTGPGCPLCQGRADVFTTDAHLTEVAHINSLGTWLSWHPSEHRLADLVEACTAAAWVGGRWPATVRFVTGNVHELPARQQHLILNGGAAVHPQAPARAREILGAAILEAGATINSFTRNPAGSEGDMSRLKSRLLASEHVMSRARESKWVHRRLRTRHFDRDDVEAQLADELLGRGIAASVAIAAVLTS
jgi:hypothetical protein